MQLAAAAAPTSASQNTATSTTSQTSSTPTIADFGQFLQLFVSQLKNQDPLSPLQGDQFLAETAQFSSVEQLVSLNKQATDSAAAIGLSTRASAASLIGRTVAANTTDDKGNQHESKGRVVGVNVDKDGQLLLGLEDGTSVRFADVVSVSET